jgi:thiol-disulfide isomerase/thioredoxin
MPSIKSILPGALALLALSLASLTPMGAKPVPPRPAPSWKLLDVEGKTVTSDQFKGKVVVLDFWATWCAPCKTEIPGYVELQKKYAADGLVIVGVSVDQEGPDVVKKFIKDYGINYPIVMYNDDILAAFGNLDLFPSTFIIDRDGMIRDEKQGKESTADYEKEILAVLKPHAA